MTAGKETTPPRDHDTGPRQWRREIVWAAVSALAALAGLFLIHGGRWLVGETIFKGVVQEQYYFLGQYAFDHKIISDFKNGLFPLWNELNALGTPLLGNMLSGVFFPLKAWIYAFPGLVARDVYIVVRVMIAAALAYALARRLRLGRPAALFAAVSFALTGYFKLFINENYLNADALLPGLALFTLRLCEKRKFLDFVALSALIFAALNNGHPEAAFYTLLLPIFLAAAGEGARRRIGRSGALFAGAAIVAGILSLPMLLPFIEYWGRGYHFHVPNAGFFHYGARQASAILSPWFFGQAPAGAPFLAPTGFAWTEVGNGLPAYDSTAVPWLFPSLGAVTVFLWILALGVARRLARVELALAAYSIFFTGVAFGLPLFRLLGFLPVFSFSGNFKHPLPAVALCASLLGARGLQLVAAGRITGTRVAWTLIALLFVVLVLAVAHEPLPGGPGYLNAWSSLILAVLILCGAWLSALAWALGDGGGAGWRKPAAGITYVAAVLASLFVLALDGRQQPMRDPGYLERISAGGAVTALSTIDPAPTNRVYLSQDIAPPNLNIIMGLPDLRVMDGINDRRLVMAINKMNSHDRAQAGTYWYRTVGYLQPMPTRLGHPLIDLFNVRYAVMDGPMPYNTTPDTLMAKADILAPDKNHVGKTRLPFSSGDAPGILHHPPSRISMEIETGKTWRLRLRPAILEQAAPQQPDGIFFLAMLDGKLTYSRYIHPEGHPADEYPPIMNLKVQCGPDTVVDKCALVLAAHPFVTADYDQGGWADLRLGDKEDFDLRGFELMYSGGDYLYQNPDAQPRAFVVSSARSAANEEAALDALADGQVIFSRAVLVEEGEDGHGSALGESIAGEVRSMTYGPQRIELEIEMYNPGWLVVGDLFYPGWKAELDGVPVRIRRGDYLLRTLPVPAGRHLAVMFYRPASFAIGLWSALAMFLVLGAALVYWKFSARPSGKVFQDPAG